MGVTGTRTVFLTTSLVSSVLIAGCLPGWPYNSNSMGALFNDGTGKWTQKASDSSIAMNRGRGSARSSADYQTGRYRPAFTN